MIQKLIVIIKIRIIVFLLKTFMGVNINIILDMIEVCVILFYRSYGIFKLCYLHNVNFMVKLI